MIGRLIRLAILVVAVDLAAGIAYDAHLAHGGAAACLSLPQHPSAAAVRRCETAAAGVWTRGLPWASSSILQYAQLVWKNANHGRNTVQ